MFSLHLQLEALWCKALSEHTLGMVPPIPSTLKVTGQKTGKTEKKMKVEIYKWETVSDSCLKAPKMFTEDIFWSQTDIH